jgi:hypothetical protein
MMDAELGCWWYDGTLSGGWTMFWHESKLGVHRGAVAYPLASVTMRNLPAPAILCLGFG